MTGTLDRRRFLSAAGKGLLAAGLGGLAGACARRPGVAPATSKATLRWWDYFLEPARQSSVRALIADIEANVPGIKIERRVFPFADLAAALSRGSTSGDLPDIAIVDNPQVSPLAAAGCLADLTERANAWGETSAYYAGPWSSCQVENKVVAIPNNSNCLALFYDAGALDAAGVRPPTNWPELAAAVGKLTTPDRHGLAMSAIGTEEGVFQFLPFLWQAGGDLATFAADGAVALGFLGNLVQTGGLAKQCLDWTQQDTNVQFVSGRAAMQVNGPWQIPTLKQQSSVTWKVVPLPAGKTEATALGGENWVVFKDSEHLDEAWDAVLRTQKPEVLVPFLDGLGILPARRDLASAGSWATDETLQLFLKQLEKAKARSYGAKYPAMSGAISQAERAVFTGTDTAVSAARAAADTITANLSK